MEKVKPFIADFKRAQILNAKAQWPRTFKARFIQPGLVHYDDMGTVLVERPCLNKMAQSFVGKPVIDEVHKDVNPDNFKDIADGVVIRVWTDPVDGWDWCEFLVWDDQARKHCESREYSVSCAYTPSEVNQVGGKHNNLEYDGEFLNGTYTHLAIVRDPRYEKAIIVTNSKGGNSMFSLFRKKDQEEKAEVRADDELEIEGERVPLAKAIEAYNALNGMKDEDTIRVNGKNVSIKELKNAYMAECKRKNAQEKGEKAGDQEEAEEKEKEEGKKRDKGEAANAEDEEKEEKEKKNRKNDVEEESVEEDTKRRDKVDKEAKNSADDKKAEEKGKYAKEFAEVAEMRNNEPSLPTINTMSERLALGKARYGGVKNKEAA